ncbi:MAG TPA: hypothetical protein VGF67_14615 [Ktedonobacteraceae bacterium]|jgi:hypothetical protein
MNTSATIPFTQMIFSWTLLGVLLAWMCFCAFLALRPRKAKNGEVTDLPTPSGAFPAIVSHVPLRRATVPVEVSFSTRQATSSEATGHVGSTPVA